MEFTLRPIGVVHSSISDRKDMPGEGVPASVEVFAPFRAGLQGMEANTHVTVVAWLHEGDRANLAAHSKRDGDATRGVFTTRTADRPNPLGISQAKIERLEDGTIYLKALDFVDGTPVLDVKGPVRGWDYAWSASGYRDVQLVREPNVRWALGLLLLEAENFHGERCPGLALGTRMVYHAMRTWQVAARDPALKATVGVDGCVADAVQALCGATLGNGRLRVSSATAFHFQLEEKGLTFWLHDLEGRSVEEILTAEAGSLFTVVEGPATHEEEAADSAGPSLAGERRAEVLAAIRAALVQGKLPCPVAYKLARQVGVGLRQIGRLANEEGIKISRCQLGCFR